MDDKEPLVVLWVPFKEDAVAVMGDKHVAVLGLFYVQPLRRCQF